MGWNWELKDWPKFEYDTSKLQGKLDEFYLLAGQLLGINKTLSEPARLQLRLDIITEEALKTSEIEGEFFNRESVQSSIQRQFGLVLNSRKVNAGEFAIAEMMVDLYQSIDEPITHDSLFRWHSMLMNGRRDLIDIGKYRTKQEPMQVVSGPLGKPKVHFEAPPSSNITAEMEQFIQWLNDTGRQGVKPLHPVIRAGIAHLYFVSIHPFEDGNGRIARAISERTLSDGLGYPSLIALSFTIEKYKNRYYDLLAKSNQRLDITEWLAYFCETVTLAQKRSIDLVDFILAKTKFYLAFKGRLNSRQQKVVDRIFQVGIEGFQGGLSLKNYISICQTSRATATRDLQNLVAMEAMVKTGQLKGTRYHLNLAHAKIV